MVTEPDQIEKSEKKTRKLPAFYSDLIGALLISYSTSTEQTRYIVACDLCGYVNSALNYCKIIDAVEKGSEKTYRVLMQECQVNLNNAVMQFKTGETYLGNEYLNLAMNTLKQIIMDNNYVSAGWSYVSNPLGTASVDQDRVQNNRYKEI